MATDPEIKRVRDRLGESQAEFAKRFGVDQTTIHRWETVGIPKRGAARIAIEGVLAALAIETHGAAE